MKKVLSFSLLTCLLLLVTGVFGQQDKSKRPSPPAQVSETTSKGLTITIDYSQPSVKGRTIGKDIAPFGKVWRTGANEATTFEINKDAKVEGKSLKAGNTVCIVFPEEMRLSLFLIKPGIKGVWFTVKQKMHYG